MIIKCKETNTDIQLALLNYRNTPLDKINASPSQLLMSRRLCSCIPITKPMLQPRTQKNRGQEIKQIIKKNRKCTMVGNTNRNITQTLGDKVYYKTYRDTWEKGTITEWEN